MYKVPTGDITPGIVLQNNIYREDIPGSIPLLCEGETITAKFLYMMKRRGITFIFTKDPYEFGSQYGRPKIRGGENPHAVLGIQLEKSRSAVKPRTKEDVLKTMKNFHISLSGLDVEEVHKAITELDKIIERLLKDFPDNEFLNVHYLRSEDNNYIHKHLLSVAVISMALGQHLNLSPKEVVQLGKCAALHDIGFFLVPQEILQKPDSLNYEEMEALRKHPITGYNVLKKLGVDSAICEGVVCHHERISGLGYPLGLHGGKIPLWSKIIGVADVYDAMTSERPYREALTPSEVCDHLTQQANVNLDFDVVNALLQCIEFFPVGVPVELSDKRRAVVVNNNNDRLRPKVQIVDSNEVIDLNNSKNIDINIVRTIKYREIIEQKERLTMYK